MDVWLRGVITAERARGAGQGVQKVRCRITPCSVLSSHALEKKERERERERVRENKQARATHEKETEVKNFTVQRSSDVSGSSVPC